MYVSSFYWSTTSFLLPPYLPGALPRTSVELDSLTQEQTHDLTLPLEGSPSGTIHLLLTITGTAVREEEQDTHTSSSPGYKRTARGMEEMARKYVSEAGPAL